MEENELLLIAKALRLEGCKFASLEIAMQKNNSELYSDYLKEFEKRKLSIQNELDSIDTILNELSLNP